MNETNIQKIKHKWGELLRQLEITFGEKPDLQGMIFLIGVQELGKGYQNFTKEEKQDLMHIAVCRLLHYEGVFEFVGRDADGWPHFERVKDLPPLGPDEQERLMKEAVLSYFEAH